MFLALKKSWTDDRPLIAAALALVGALMLWLAPTDASAWAPAATAPIHPGVMTNTEGSGQCTSNFIFTRNGHTYIGQAAHCSSTGAATDTNGCTAASLPLGTKVDIDGASVRGTLAYNSWLTMQGNGEADEETCAYNDLALVEIDPADVGEGQPVDP